MSEITLLINKSEIAAGTRGSSLGPEAIMIAAANQTDSIFNRYDYQLLSNENSAMFSENKFVYAKRINSVFKQLEVVSEQVTMQLSNGKVPFILSGDHCSAAGTIAGIRNFDPNSKIGIIWIDAHADLHSPFTSPSGNMHGMPLAIALNKDNEHIASNKPDQETISYWEKIKSLAEGPWIKAEDIVFIGLRSYEFAEENYIKENNIKTIMVNECRSKSISDVVKNVLEYLKNCDSIYISFDVDCMDPDLVSFGTGTPVKDGFSEDECLQFISGFCSDERLIGLEIVEVNPCLDNKKNRMAEAAYNILQKAIDVFENLRK